MGEQVRLRFVRSKDPRTDYYNIYRSTEPGVGRHSARIMKVKQPNHPVAVRIKEKPEEINNRVYVLTKQDILLDKGFLVYKNGNLFAETNYEVDAERGMLFLKEATWDAIEVDYHFDGIEVVDDVTGNDPEKVEHYGPAIGNRKVPPPPKNISIRPTDEGMRVDYQIPETYGMNFHYAIESVSVDGSRSLLSVPAPIHLADDIMGIVLEREAANGTWTQEEFPGYTEYIVDRKADQEPPEGLGGFQASLVQEKDGRYVKFTWDTPLKNNISGMSPRYRLRTRGISGELSEPSRLAGPELVKSALDRIVIYERNAALGPAPYGDPQATKLTEILFNEPGVYRHKVTKDGSFAYSAFVLDRAGNHSIASTAIITT